MCTLNSVYTRTYIHIWQLTYIRKDQCTHQYCITSTANIALLFRAQSEQHTNVVVRGGIQIIGFFLKSAAGICHKFIVPSKPNKKLLLLLHLHHVDTTSIDPRLTCKYLLDFIDCLLLLRLV